MPPALDKTEIPFPSDLAAKKRNFTKYKCYVSLTLNYVIFVPYNRSNR